MRLSHLGVMGVLLVAGCDVTEPCPTKVILEFPGDPFGAGRQVRELLDTGWRCEQEPVGEGGTRWTCTNCPGDLPY